MTIDRLTLYSNPMSRGRMARWMLEETGVAYETVMLGYGTSMKAAHYLAINPMGKVPAITHGAKIITECAAVCAYLADAFPDAGLAPPASDRADYYRWLFFAAGPVEAAVTNKALGVETPDEKKGMVGYGDLSTIIDILEVACLKNDYLAGKRFTAADVYAGSQIGWGLQFGNIEKRPAFEDYWSRLTERSAYQRARELDDAAMAAQTGGAT